MSVNKVILIGNLGQDPEVRYMPNGNAVANITVATSESWKDQQGQAQERTEWHRCVLYRRLAEIAGEYLKKGSKVYLEGRLQTREWQDQQGQKRHTTEIVINDLQMLDGRSGGGNTSRPQGGQQNQGNAPRPQGGQQSQGNASRPQGGQPNQGYASQPQGGQPNQGAQGGYPSDPGYMDPAGGGGWEDDIPFMGITKSMTYCV